MRYFISIILLFLFSCQKNFDIIDSLQNDESGQLSIQDAQQWFNKQHSNVNNSRQSAENTKAPNWNRASSLDFEFGEGIVVPLAYQQNYSVSFIKNKKYTTQNPKAVMIFYPHHQPVLQIQVQVQVMAAMVATQVLLDSIPLKRQLKKPQNLPLKLGHNINKLAIAHNLLMLSKSQCRQIISTDNS